MRLRWLQRTPPLSPPPTAKETEWWGRVRRRIGLKHGLMQAVPFIIVFTIIGIIRERFGVHMFVVVPLLATLAALLGWAATEKHYRSQHIRWKRVREELGSPGELP